LRCFYENYSATRQEREWLLLSNKPTATVLTTLASPDPLGAGLCVLDPEETKTSTISTRWRLYLAEREGFEPPLRCRKPDFESGAFDRSATSPVLRLEAGHFTKKAAAFPVPIMGAPMSRILHRTRARKRLQAALILAAIAVAGAPLSSMAEQNLLTLGTGGVTGVYYTVGSAICRLVNKERVRHDVRCAVESTAGSVANVEAIRAGRLDMGIAQSDVQHLAADGELRAVMSLHSESLTVLARKGLEAKSFADLKGRKLNVGNPGSGTRASLEELLAALHWKLADFAVASELPADEHGQALCDGKIDAFFYPVGHPSGHIRDLVTGCGARLLPIEGPAIEKLLAEKPYYVKTVIPGGLYPGHPDDIATYGVVATLATSSKVPANRVYVLVKAVFDHLDEFRRLHPALARLSPQEMVANGLTAPLHEGAAKYYRERGWIR
jgi:TRAP transporter TAXI family solute receptor